MGFPVRASRFFVPGSRRLLFPTRWGDCGGNGRIGKTAGEIRAKNAECCGGCGEGPWTPVHVPHSMPFYRLSGTTWEEMPKKYISISTRPLCQDAPFGWLGTGFNTTTPGTYAPAAFYTGEDSAYEFWERDAAAVAVDDLIYEADIAKKGVPDESMPEVNSVHGWNFTSRQRWLDPNTNEGLALDIDLTGSGETRDFGTMPTGYSNPGCACNTLQTYPNLLVGSSVADYVWGGSSFPDSFDDALGINPGIIFRYGTSLSKFPSSVLVTLSGTGYSSLNTTLSLSRNGGGGGPSWNDNWSNLPVYQAFGSFREPNANHPINPTANINNDYTCSLFCSWGYIFEVFQSRFGNTYQRLLEPAYSATIVLQVMDRTFGVGSSASVEWAPTNPADQPAKDATPFVMKSGDWQPFLSVDGPLLSQFSVSADVSVA